MRSVICDECQRPITIHLVEAPATDGDGVVQYFDCPHCRHRYPVAHITALGLRLRVELRGLRTLLHRQPSARLQRKVDTVDRDFRAQVRDLTKSRRPELPSS